MPDTSRAARHILKDYVNAKLLFAHPPPNIDVDEFMSTSRERTLRLLEESFENGRKRAPASHVTKNADTYVAPASSSQQPLLEEITAESSAAGATARERQLTTKSIKANSAAAPMRSGREKGIALDGAFFNEAGPAARPVVAGSRHHEEKVESAHGFSRPMQYAHQRMLGPDGMPLIMTTGKANKQGARNNDKKHFKVKEGKKRSGRGYD